MLEESSALKSDCSGLLGLTASAPEVAAFLAEADMLGDAARRKQCGSTDCCERDGRSERKIEGAHATEATSDREREKVR